MNVENYLQLLRLASSSNTQQENSAGQSESYEAFQTLVHEISTIGIIINILANSENYSTEVITLSISLLRHIIEKGNFTNEAIQNPKIFYEFSSGLFALLQKFQNNLFISYILVSGILAFSSYHEPTFSDKLFEIAGATLKSENIFTNVENGKLALKIFRGLIQANSSYGSQLFVFFNESAISLFNQLNTIQDYTLYSKILKLYHSFYAFCFPDCIQHLEILNVLFTIIQNYEKTFTLNDSAFKLLCESNSLLKCIAMNFDQKKDLTNPIIKNFLLEISPKIFDTFLDFCLSLPNYPDFSENYKEIGGYGLEHINNFFNKIQLNPVYFDKLLKIVIDYSSLTESEENEIQTNVLNYYCTAYPNEKPFHQNPRTISYYLIRKLSNIDENRVISFLTNIPPKENIFFLLSKLLKFKRRYLYLKCNDTLQILSQYIITALSNIKNFPIHYQFMIFHLAAKGIMILPKETIVDNLLIQSVQMAQLSETQEINPMSCFAFTIASEILYNYARIYKIPQSDIIPLFLKNADNSFTTVILKAFVIIGKDNPELFASSQLHVIDLCLGQLQVFLESPSSTFFNKEMDDKIISTLNCLSNQSSVFCPDFPLIPVVEMLKKFVPGEFNKDYPDFETYLPNVVEVFTSICETYENSGFVLEFFGNLIDTSLFSMYLYEIVQPFLAFLGNHPHQFIESNIGIQILPVLLNIIETDSPSIGKMSSEDLKDDFAIFALLARLIQLLKNSIPQELATKIFEIIHFLLCQNNHQKHLCFLGLELYSSFVVFMGKSTPFLQEIVDSWLKFCCTGCILGNYYRILHFLGFQCIISLFPEKNGDFQFVLQNLSQNSFKQDDLFLSCFYYFYSFVEFKSPVEYVQMPECFVYNQLEIHKKNDD
ncbi:hypothetical protein TRFO_27398 [Tritrichomonas foetus]|uniref:Uncharacterized protein n=1 Tax=Tritrichomonas foetus TaxID=1144522 RepID=A0A1J4K5Q1_9EUKA|nr:hypothetical protein TRFO_27398 [Tritrichomonas foetus]|eukprot:OHT05006.1 hypothetical protein TRFO_27398 [Tritrichomonas foetus]